MSKQEVLRQAEIVRGKPEFNSEKSIAYYAEHEVHAVRAALEQR